MNAGFSNTSYPHFIAANNEIFIWYKTGSLIYPHCTLMQVETENDPVLINCCHFTLTGSQAGMSTKCTK